MQPPLLVVIPACNEAGRIGAVLDSVHALGVGADLLVVDDGSRDGTAAEARAHGARVVSHAHNLGYGAALHTGYLYARRRRYPRIVQMDADGQHDAASIPRLLAALDEGADVVVGSRWLADSAPKTSFARRSGSRFFAAIVTGWTKTPITDPTSGFQALSQRALAEVARDVFPEDYPDADVLIALGRAGLKLREVPATMHERRGGVSMHRGAKILYYAYKMLLSLSLLPVRRQHVFRGKRDPAPQAG